MGLTHEGPSAWRANERERRYGKIMPNEKEIIIIREKAQKAGKDPNIAEREYFEKLGRANAHPREAQEEQTRESVEKIIGEELK